MGDHAIQAAIVHGTGNFSRLIEKIAKEKKGFHYVEIKGCPNGCAQGGGQPLPYDNTLIRARAHALYKLDATKEIRKAHENPVVKQIYDRILKKPAGSEAKKLVHTKFSKRQRYL
jgi:iron only hydrogenase large subunit-like protein